MRPDYNLRCLLALPRNDEDIAVAKALIWPLLWATLIHLKILALALPWKLCRAVSRLCATRGANPALPIVLLLALCVALPASAQDYGALKVYTTYTDAHTCQVLASLLPNLCRHNIMVTAMSDNTAVRKFAVTVTYDAEGQRKTETQTVTPQVRQRIGNPGEYVIGWAFFYPQNFSLVRVSVTSLVEGETATRDY